MSISTSPIFSGHSWQSGLGREVADQFVVRSQLDQARVHAVPQRLAPTSDTSRSSVVPNDPVDPYMPGGTHV